MLRGALLTMEVMRYQFSRSANSSEERVLTHYSEVSLLLEDRPDFPEELRGAKKGMLYLTQYKMIFQHKDKGSTIIRFPLQLLEDCSLEDEPSSKPQCIKGTLTSGRGAVSFKLTFCHGAAECLSMIKDLSEADMLREGRNLQEYPTASIYTYAHPGAPRPARSLNTFPLWPPPYPGPPDLPPPYSEVQATSLRANQGSDQVPLDALKKKKKSLDLYPTFPSCKETQETHEGCCRCRRQQIQNQMNRQD